MKIKSEKELEAFFGEPVDVAELADYLDVTYDEALRMFNDEARLYYIRLGLNIIPFLLLAVVLIVLFLKWSIS